MQEKAMFFQKAIKYFNLYDRWMYLVQRYQFIKLQEDILLPKINKSQFQI